jgi:hypothetical protein
VLGATVRTLGSIPLRKPLIPSREVMIRRASAIPRALRIRGSVESPRVCKSVWGRQRSDKGYRRST